MLGISFCSEEAERQACLGTPIVSGSAAILLNGVRKPATMNSVLTSGRCNLKPKSCHAAAQELQTRNLKGGGGVRQSTCT